MNSGHVQLLTVPENHGSDESTVDPWCAYVRCDEDVVMYLNVWLEPIPQTKPH
jgi:hypothetical protein